jgi:hypothetical protein
VFFKAFRSVKLEDVSSTSVRVRDLPLVGGTEDGEGATSVPLRRSSTPGKRSVTLRYEPGGGSPSIIALCVSSESCEPKL